MPLPKTLRGLAVIAIATLSATAGSAAVQSFEFVTTTWGRGLNGGTGNTNAYLSSKGVQGFGFSFGGQDVGFSGGFFHDGFYNSGNGRPFYSTTPTTYGPGAEPSALTGSQIFVQGGADYTPVDLVGANVGFKTTDGNYGYVVFDWNAATDTMTFLSGAYETTAGVAITVPAAVPLPAGLALLIPGLVTLGGMRVMARRRAT